MNRIINFGRKTAALTRSIVTWSRIRPRNTVLSVTGTAAVITGTVLFFIYVFPVLLAVTFFVIIILMHEGTDIRSLFRKTSPISLKNNEVGWEAAQFMFLVFVKAADILGEFMHVPRTVQEIYDPDPKARLTVYNKAPLLRLRVMAKRRVFNNEDLMYIANVVQSLVDARIEAGYWIGSAWTVPKVAVDVPILKIVNAECVGIYIYFGILLTNTHISAEAARISGSPVPLLSVDDEDPLFRKGGDDL
jgi:hypothetical protein